MAAVDDIYNQITRNSRTRRGKSFFPAANSTPQGETLNVPDSRYGFRALPPDQNPAYQRALSGGRVNRNDMTTVYLPSGGTMQVPNKSLGGALAAVKDSTIQPKTAYASDYAKGYGAPAPTVQQFAGGPALVQGGVANPVANLTPQQRVGYGVGGTLDAFRTNPSLNVAVNALRGFGSNIASWFGGGNTPNLVPSANAGQPSPSPTPYQTPFPNPTPTPTPRRYSDLGYY